MQSLDSCDAAGSVWYPVKALQPNCVSEPVVSFSEAAEVLSI